MNKSDLKKLIKPLVKECIHEVLLEEGLLSNVVSEVAKGLQGSLMVESAPVRSIPAVQKTDRRASQSQQASLDAQNEKRKKKMKEQRSKMMEAVGANAYNGVNLFENTEPLSSQERPAAQAGSVDLGSPADAGVDISSLMGGATKIWKGMK
tara:strand:+ start:99 stop:551 length:453 start_codon:yes stop_codon:yes gene_type:complete